MKVLVGSARPFGEQVVATLNAGEKPSQYFSLSALQEAGVGDVASLPRTLRVLLESILRQQDGHTFLREHVDAFFRPDRPGSVPVLLSRVLGQDYTGIPLVLDFAMLRHEANLLGFNAAEIHPVIPYDLVVDHSVQVDRSGTAAALGLNIGFEFERNSERYGVLRWAHKNMPNVRVIPPGSGICHQVNCEYLATVVARDSETGFVGCDSCTGTDSHTTMVNGIGVLGFGVGGIEATASLLGRPTDMLIPRVAGVKLIGKLRDGVTATDAVLYLTEMLRQLGVVDKFVEFYGPGVSTLRAEARLSRIVIYKCTTF